MIQEVWSLLDLDPGLAWGTCICQAVVLVGEAVGSDGAVELTGGTIPME